VRSTGGAATKEGRSALNIYDQLQAIRAQVAGRRHAPETLTVLDRLIAQAEPERDNPLSISQPMVIRHLLRQRDVLNNEAVHMDILGLAADPEDRRARSDEDVPDATVDTERRPQHLRSFYKRQKEKERQQRGS
jgi:hypothetical protein